MAQGSDVVSGGFALPGVPFPDCAVAVAAAEARAINVIESLMVTTKPSQDTTL